jgi:hypothetical protein
VGVKGESVISPPLSHVFRFFKVSMCQFSSKQKKTDLSLSVCQGLLITVYSTIHWASLDSGYVLFTFVSKYSAEASDTVCSLSAFWLHNVCFLSAGKMNLGVLNFSLFYHDLAPTLRAVVRGAFPLTGKTNVFPCAFLAQLGSSARVGSPASVQEILIRGWMRGVYDSTLEQVCKNELNMSCSPLLILSLWDMRKFQQRKGLLAKFKKMMHSNHLFKYFHLLISIRFSTGRVTSVMQGSVVNELSVWVEVKSWKYVCKLPTN